ncbi:hypothetical protein V8F33_013297 [Rhypophila sp. PSN 637]
MAPIPPRPATHRLKHTAVTAETRQAQNQDKPGRWRCVAALEHDASVLHHVTGKKHSPNIHIDSGPIMVHHAHPDSQRCLGSSRSRPVKKNWNSEDQDRAFAFQPTRTLCTDQVPLNGLFPPRLLPAAFIDNGRVMARSMVITCGLPNHYRSLPHDMRRLVYAVSHLVGATCLSNMSTCQPLIIPYPYVRTREARISPFPLELIKSGHNSFIFIFHMSWYGVEVAWDSRSLSSLVCYLHLFTLSPALGQAKQWHRVISVPVTNLLIEFEIQSHHDFTIGERSA